MKDFLQIFFSTLVVFAAYSLVGVEEAQACSCMPPSPVAQALERHDAVFVATIAEARQVGMGFEIVMNVERSWKGVDEEKVEVMTASSSAACGYPFHHDTSYLVYASMSEGTLMVSLCSRTRPVEGNEAELLLLDELYDVATTTTPVIREDGGEFGGLFDSPRCPVGQQAQVERWGCVLPAQSQKGSPRFVPGQLAPLICRFYGLPAVEKWQCEQPGPQLR